MAGRGVDIKLGGNSEFMANAHAQKENKEDDHEYMEQLIKEYDSSINDEKEKVKDLGGLYVIGTERHESRRIDNQLRGRSGRQGDPGVSRFFLSLEDNLMRIFASDKVSEIMKKLGMQEGEAIEH